MREVVAHADRGGPVIGICNGFQIACEAGLLPARCCATQASQFVSELVASASRTTETLFTNRYERARSCACRSRTATDATPPTTRRSTASRANGQVVFRYVNAHGEADAGVEPEWLDARHRRHCQRRGNVLGLMPHPERAVEPSLGSADGARVVRVAARPGRCLSALGCIADINFALACLAMRDRSDQSQRRGVLREAIDAELTSRSCRSRAIGHARARHEAASGRRMYMTLPALRRHV